MATENQRIFQPFRLDPTNAQLWRDDQEISLRRKTFEVLRYLVDHPGQLVTKTALLDALWGDVAVGDSMPAICIAELRKVLGDEAKAPRFIETAHRRGYRFIAKVTTAPVSATFVQPPSPPQAPTPIVVGRTEELAHLREWYARATRGRPALVFVAGEAGIGKTTFVRVFLDSIRRDAVRIGRGQCIEHYGSGEPYMPVFEALTRLSQEPGGEQVVETLRRLAPTWLAQMPSLLSDPERERLQGAAQVITQQRMLREMAQALESLAAEIPLVLALEDLHWADFSTLELISVIARRIEPARLLIVGTYRPVEILTSDHPLRAMKEELELHRHCDELRLRLLSENDVAAYLRLRFGDSDTAQSLSDVAPLIHQRTDGNPLFMVNVVDSLVEQGSLLEAHKIETPRSVLQMIGRNFERLSPEEQTILETASVAGVEFSAASVAAALERPVTEIEACCARLARREQFINAHGVSAWPDGSVASSFRFHHGLYGDVLYARVPTGLRVGLHRKIAEREEQAHGARSAEIAAELAHHYLCANDNSKAIRFLHLAGERAVRRSANREAVAHFSTALKILGEMPQSLSSRERDEQELGLQMALAAPLTATNGFASPEVARVYARARELCQRMDEAPQLFPVLWGLALFYTATAQHSAALELGEQCLHLAEATREEALEAEAHHTVGVTRMAMGEFASGLKHLEQAIALYDPDRHGSLAFQYGQDTGVVCRAHVAQALWLLGSPAEAVKRAAEAMFLAQRLSQPYSLATVSVICAWVSQMSGDENTMLERAETAVALANEKEFAFWGAMGVTMRGRALATQGQMSAGIEQMRSGLATLRGMRAEILRPYYLGLLAEAYGRALQTKEGLAVLAEAQDAISKSGEHYWEAEVCRLKGELTLQQSGARGRQSRAQAEAEQCFERALAIARAQEAKSLELRAATSLSRLQHMQGRTGEARLRLAEVHGRFSEGFDMPDLRAATALLIEMS